ncbi:hypothetical protein EVB27_061 [Rhizobium phage RHph_TM16]|nr:hypothetical protein EVB27_061 [Rhizobium phage RHph_TM16]
MSAKRRLSSSKLSPFYDEHAIAKVDKVFVNDAHLPNCIAYDMDAGWAQQQVDGAFKPKQYGEIKVTLKG